VKRSSDSFIITQHASDECRSSEGPTETFDILDCTGGKTGQVIGRDEAHRTGTWHGAFHCLILSLRDGRAYALFQKRAAQKKIAPNMFDVSVGGHYATGEDARIAGPREIMEELGLDVRFTDLLPLGRRVFVYCFTPGVLEYEFQDVFLLVRDIRPEACILQTDEVDGVLEMDLEQGIGLFSGGVRSIECSLYRNGTAVERESVSAEGFVPCLDNYYLKLLLLARRYVQGERKLLFI
jgi:isopentenyldiphosphate isomerase